MATLSDVAARAGVSISAVSRVLSNAPSTRVSAATRARIHAAAAELGYRPNFAGRALRSSRTNVLALLVPDLTNAIFTDLMHGVEDGAHELGYVVLLARSEDMRTRGETLDRLLGEGRVDGVLLQLGDTLDTGALDAVLQAGSPTVLVNTMQPDFVGSVTLDDFGAARTAAEHLIALGHRRIALVNGLPATFTARQRLAGFQAALAEAGIDVPADYITDLGYEPSAGRRALRLLMQLAHPPTALLVANVNAAIGVLGEARSLGIRVPHELSVVGVHDVWLAEDLWPPLTTVRMPLYELGRRGVQELHARLRGGDVSDVRITDPAPQLIVRESTSAKLA
jgi:LacI family transcriptional regulator